MVSAVFSGLFQGLLNVSLLYAPKALNLVPQTQVATKSIENNDNVNSQLLVMWI